MAVFLQTEERRTAANAASIFGAEAVSRLTTFVMAMVIARRFGPQALGEYAYALAWVGILLVLPDMGSHLLTTRELAARPERLSVALWRLMFLKAGLLAGVVVMTALLAEFAIHDEGRRLLFLILAARMILHSVSLGCAAVFKAFERMHYIAVTQMVNGFACFGALGVCLLLRTSLIAVVGVLVVGQAFETWLAWRILFRRFNPGPAPKWNWKPLAGLFSMAAPVGIVILLQTIGLRLDILILGIFAPNRELGRLQAAAWFITLSFLLATLLMTVLFPKLARLGRFPGIERIRYVETLLQHGTLFAAALAAIAWLAAPYLIEAFFGKQFGSAISLLHILAPAIPFVFINTVLFYVFVAADRRKTYLVALSFSLVCGLVAAYVLAAHWGATGVVWADFEREFVECVLLLFCLDRACLIPNLGPALFKAAVWGASFTAIAFAAGWVHNGEVCAAIWSFTTAAGLLVFAGPPRWRQIVLLAAGGRV
ncbi:MAG TPA: oligosaccharide flippase family protein [Terriglobia bacterium]|nr:oligosaccharide flippase family protein [Terriglobia bacterium]